MTMYYFETGSGHRITRGDIRALRAQATADGDAAQVELCERALNGAGEFADDGTVDAWRQCASVLLSGVQSAVLLLKVPR